MLKKLVRYNFTPVGRRYQGYGNKRGVMDITEKNTKEIAIYCKANGIDDVNGF
jgi:hypothetical protein